MLYWISSYKLNLTTDKQNLDKKPCQSWRSKSLSCLCFGSVLQYLPHHIFGMLQQLLSEIVEINAERNADGMKLTFLWDFVSWSVFRTDLKPSNFINSRSGSSNIISLFRMDWIWRWPKTTWLISASKVVVCFLLLFFFRFWRQKFYYVNRYFQCKFLYPKFIFMYKLFVTIIQLSLMLVFSLFSGLI